MISRDRATSPTSLTHAEHEARFLAKHYLKHYQPTPDDLASGIVDGSLDAGIDGMYLFVNGYCIRDDSPLAGIGKNAQLDLFIVQVKNTKGFREDALDKLCVNLPRLFDFNRDEAALSKTVNAGVIEISRRFLRAYRNLEMPSLRIFIAYASLRATELHPNTGEKGEVLRSTIAGCFAGADVSMEFLDAARITDLVREKPATSRKLALAENPISTDKAGGYIAVVKLDEYERFITGESGELDAGLFDANVRDYEGETAVNRSIQGTLESEDVGVDFWWLNNGVTIVATRVQPANKLLELESPQIVNGLQTSNEIYKRSRSGRDSSDDRSVLIKVIQAQDSEVRDRIIRATNSQTSLGPSALRATDRVQREIEEHLSTLGLYYERRRRQHTNNGIPEAKIVTIDQMGCALLSALGQIPHIARGELSRIFETDVYDLLFSPEHPILAYSSCISLYRANVTFLVEDPSTRPHRQDFENHLTMLTAMALTRRERPSAADLAAIPPEGPPIGLQEELLTLIRDEYARHTRVTGELLFDQIAKDSRVTNKLVERGRAFVRQAPRH
ncbi:hypothetical protein B8281_01735 [Cellulosimicrobium sp. TH-20]|nr:hypothetical protein B8281_01735 [Cellulosimicrobium sp. TH-20]